MCALIASVIVLLIYLIALLADFIAPFNTVKTDAKYLYAPPQGLHVEIVGGSLQAYVEGYTSKVDPAAMRRTFQVDPQQRIPVGFLVHGDPL